MPIADRARGVRHPERVSTPVDPGARDCGHVSQAATLRPGTDAAGLGDQLAGPDRRGSPPAGPERLLALGAGRGGRVHGIFGVLVRPVLWLSPRPSAGSPWRCSRSPARPWPCTPPCSCCRASRPTSFWTLVAATWIAAVVGTGLTWMVTAGNDDAFTVALRRFGHKAGPSRPGGRRGRLRADGRGPLPGRALGPAVGHDADAGALGERAAATASTSGPSSCRAPLRPASRGSCTAPATGVPAFRWYDRELGRVARREPAGRRRDHRAAREHRARPAGR